MFQLFHPIGGVFAVVTVVGFSGAAAAAATGPAVIIRINADKAANLRIRVPNPEYVRRILLATGRKLAGNVWPAQATHSRCTIGA
ncbi:hypothetical protein GCM10009765_01630 [Fodinicola feengrottensis]|uniref:Uncharacterized protein n=1 Tax=Fodinicola feengrottensis TaxID=435914 RepID=A0ABP4RMA0_9ACTN